MERASVISQQSYSRLTSCFKIFSSLDSDEQIQSLAKEANCTPGTLLAIFRCWLLEYVKKNYSRFKTESFVSGCWRRLQETSRESALYDEAKSLQIPPCLLARLVIGWYLKETATNKQIFSLLKEPESIELPWLRSNVLYCIDRDVHYTPAAESHKQAYGLERERAIEEFLRCKEVSFLAQSELQQRGYSKTPDFVLCLPIAIKRERDWHVINWIESKGSFGSASVHRKNLSEQLWSYHNRFGPGLVIYWGGYVKDIDENYENGILIDVSPPSEIEVLKLPLTLEIKSSS